ncbi:hypothetical protein DU48_13665 [Methanosarcina mazei]|uniref:Uncharacterized protein n=1 Tax=Methanosarcina mazei TaxID=2209 RepID=A0A0F8LYI3_METMZ|nr:hypothetical protein DU48_13665 [Methanosarcina mazei]
MEFKNEIQKRSPTLHVKSLKAASSGEAICLQRLRQPAQSRSLGYTSTDIFAPPIYRSSRCIRKSHLKKVNTCSVNTCSVWH